MQERLTHARLAFYFGLILVMTPGILSATAWPQWRNGFVALALTGAVVALIARLWQGRLLRTARRGGGSVGFPLNLAGHSRFTAR